MPSIAEVAATNDELETLRAMRDKLAASMDIAEPSVVAQVSGRLEAVLKRITELGGAGEATLDDVLAERRQQRAKRSQSAG
jgi:CHASE3 domain sensor protein